MNRFLAFLPCAALAALALPGCGDSARDSLLQPSEGPALAAAIPGLEALDFDSVPAGTQLFSISGNLGTGPVLVRGNNPHLGANAAVVFDSANPTGGDCDLGTPNSAFGGPGCGTMVGPGTQYENDVAQGNVLIVAADLVDNNNDGLVDDPDDFNQPAFDHVWVQFNFQNVGPQTMQCLTVVDIDGNGPNPRVEMYAADSTLIATVPIPSDMPDNGKAVVDLGATPGVAIVVVHLQGSGAIDNLVFGESETGEIGDFVWCDLNDDGVQDPGEPGLSGVVVNLTCTLADGSVVTDSQTTDGNGFYLFTDLPAGTCDVSVDVTTAPPDCDEPGRCPTSMTVDLGPGESFLDADFCFKQRTPEDCCENGKPVVLTLQYTGEDCSASSHKQDPGKVTCSGDPALASPVRIVVTDKDDPSDSKAKLFFDGVVALGGLFDADAANAGEDKFKSNTWVHVLDGAGNILQSVQFHTSCSQPLCTGDQFGSVRVIDCIGEDEPTNGGTGDSCDDGDPQVLTMRYTGDDCSVSSHSQDPGKVSCTGDPAFADPVHILATDKDDPTDSKAKVFFNGVVALGALFDIDATNAGENKLKSNTWVHIRDGSGATLQTLQFHTSCSQPLAVGDRFGSLTVEVFTPEP